MKKNFILVAALTMAFVRCTDKDLNLEGITARNADGSITQGTTADNTDWRLTDNFTNAEADLFGVSKTVAYCQATGGSSIMVYPNPGNGVFVWQNTLGTEYKVQLKIVRSDMSLVKSFDFATNDDAQLNISNLVKDGESVRVYYRFIGTDGCEFRGHGDLKIKK